jgi:hypothetical protein
MPARIEIHWSLLNLSSCHIGGQMGIQSLAERLI